MPVPIVAVAGFGVTVVLVARIVTASADVPDPPAFVVSPEYVAVIQIWPDFDGVYDIVHVLEAPLEAASVHVGLLKVPPALLSLHDTVPVGLVGVPLVVSVTTAEKVVDIPTVPAAGFDDTEVEVGPGNKAPTSTA